LIDAKDASGMNKVYGDFFTVEPYPSRATLIVRELERFAKHRWLA
jgi:enamine deaminase RidA (YjgF/YER057c/UK114 family)